MAIVAPPEEYLGQLLYLRPGYGWGWRGADESERVDYAPIDAAGGCQVRVSRFFTWRGEVRGVVGKVEQPGHIFHNLWIVCGAMIKGEHDFTEHLCLRYDLELGLQEPGEEEWPCIAAGKRHYAGYGILSATEPHREASQRVSSRQA
ncbi:MAG: hypothetical protein ACR2PL_02130 [Dehalococcoidia bacterium]